MLGVTFRKLTILCGACCLGLLWSSVGRAQDGTDPTNVHITCSEGTVCAEASLGGTQIQLTNSALPTFSVGLAAGESNTGLGSDTGTAVLVILVPTTSTGVGVWSSGDLYTFLGLTPSGTDPQNITGYLTATNAVAPGAVGYTVTTIVLGTVSSSTFSFSPTLTGSLPAGSIIMAYIRDNTTGNVVNGTSLSNALITSTPEPASITLFGSGLVLLGGLRRRRRQNPGA